MALVGLQDELTQACAMLEKLHTRLAVGHVRHTVQEATATKKQMEKETKKPLSYAEAARKGTMSQPPAAPRGTAPWSMTNIFPAT